MEEQLAQLPPRLDIRGGSAHHLTVQALGFRGRAVDPGGPGGEAASVALGEPVGPPTRRAHRLPRDVELIEPARGHADPVVREGEAGVGRDRRPERVQGSIEIPPPQMALAVQVGLQRRDRRRGDRRDASHPTAVAVFQPGDQLRGDAVDH
ncbi:MAG: hypothetical protein GWM90_26715, partial [Gemmatimonadetes bacterium]|nr:hypothetical protein [Gemmatimonadota bacterium]NIQ58512.1 hypothetical protein [Gemmatimonadota bacterium]NIX47530.1 hypothetical protein [Gemmatimonadota bacterium]NIY11900.1 hypothetical protein [Gemmatimonadota bacterium]